MQFAHLQLNNLAYEMLDTKFKVLELLCAKEILVNFSDVS